MCGRIIHPLVDGGANPVIVLADHGYFGNFEGCEVREAKTDELASLVKLVEGLREWRKAFLCQRRGDRQFEATCISSKFVGSGVKTHIDIALSGVAIAPVLGGYVGEKLIGVVWKVFL